MAHNSTIVQKWFDKNWVNETEDLIRFETFRSESMSNEECCKELFKVRTYLRDRIAEINAQLTELTLESFQWVQFGKDPNQTFSLDPTDDECIEAEYWVFGYAIGPENASNRICIACHADVVPAQADEKWEPFDAIVKKDQDYPSGIFKTTDVLVGRGATDNKGQMASSLAIARAISEVYDGTGILKDTRIEFVCDSAEETKMGVPYYTKWREQERNGQMPFDLGVVYDGAWMIVGEKGVERPEFSVRPRPTKELLPVPPLYLESLTTPEGTSVNTIADTATALIKGDTAVLKRFYETLPSAYYRCGWKHAAIDDKTYEPSKLNYKLNEEDGVVELTTEVRGAQHGSQAAGNEANPLACLAYFVGGLVANGTLGVTPIGAMAHFMRWEWSMNVCGEDRPGRLFREDDLFGKGIRNGTTYALTNLVKNDGKISLRLDIRYATGHHPGGWKPGDEEGLLNPDKKSLLEEYFNLETDEFMKENPTYPRIHLASSITKYPPDVRNADTNRSCQILRDAFHEEMGKYPPNVATG